MKIPGSKILDIGAGAGEYSIYFARKGYNVSALELADNNIQAFRKKMKPENKVDLVQGNAMNLSQYADKSFDSVLLFEPLYHLYSEADRQQCITEAKHVCKDDGMIFFAFISNDMVILTELCYDEKYMLGDSYDHDTFKVEDFPFVFFTVDQCRKMLIDGGIQIEKGIASDGVKNMQMKSKVFEYLLKIPEGKVVTYSQVAEHLGNKKLARVVGNILHNNPDEEKYPCYKVVNAKGELSASFAFGGKEGQKEKLLREGIEVIDYKVDLSKYGNR